MILWGQWQQGIGKGQLTMKASKMKGKVLIGLAGTAGWEKTLGFTWNAKQNKVLCYNIHFQNRWLQISGRRLSSEVSSESTLRGAKLWSLWSFQASFPCRGSDFHLPSLKSPQMQTPGSPGAHGAPWVSDSAIAVPWKNIPTVHLRLWMRGDKGRPLCPPKEAGCLFCHSLPYRAAFRLFWMVTGASGPIVPSQLSGISGDQWVRLCRSCFSGSLPFRNSFAPRESSNSCLGWLGDSFVLPELGKAAPAGPRIWLLACNLLI